MKRAVPLLLMLAACGGDEARISFAVPDSVSSLARSVRLRLVRGDLDCGAIAYGEVDAERLDGATERTLVIDAEAPTQVGEIARAVRTLFVAEAFDGPAASGALVAAGCADHDAVDGNDEIRIVGEPAVELIGLDPSLIGGVSVAADDVPDVLTLTARDAAGNAAADVDVRVRVIDVAGATLTSALTTSSTGQVAIATDFLATRPVGAVRIIVRARWQREALSIDTAAEPSQTTLAVTGNHLSSIAVGERLFLATGDIFAATLYRVQVSGGIITSTSLGALADGFRFFIGLPDGTIIALFDDSYRVLDAATGSLGAARTIDLGPMSQAVTAQVTPACGGAEAPVIVLSDPTQIPPRVVALAFTSGTLSVTTKPAFLGSDDAQVRAAGCIIDGNGGLHRAVATTDELRVESGGVMALPASAGAVRLGTPTAPELIAAVQTTGGPQARYYGLSEDASRLTLREQLAISGAASFIDTAELDGNSALDLIALVPGDSTVSVNVVYRGVEADPPLSALIALTPTPGAPVPGPMLGVASAQALVWDGDADGRVEVWSFRGFMDALGSGPAPPIPQSRTLVTRIDFTR